MFMKIDNSRQVKRHKAEFPIAATPKKKGMQELKGLIIDMKFKSNGTRYRGKGDQCGLMNIKFYHGM